MKQINDKIVEFENWDDNRLKDRISYHKNRLKELKDEKKYDVQNIEKEEHRKDIYNVEQAYLDSIMVEVFAIVKEAARRLSGKNFRVMGN